MCCMLPYSAYICSIKLISKLHILMAFDVAVVCVLLGNSMLVYVCKSLMRVCTKLALR